MTHTLRVEVRAEVATLASQQLTARSCAKQRGRDITIDLPELDDRETFSTSRGPKTLQHRQGGEAKRIRFVALPVPAKRTDGNEIAADECQRNPASR